MYGAASNDARLTDVRNRFQTNPMLENMKAGVIELAPDYEARLAAGAAKASDTMVSGSAEAGTALGTAASDRINAEAAAAGTTYGQAAAKTFNSLVQRLPGFGGGSNAPSVNQPSTIPDTGAR